MEPLPTIELHKSCASPHYNTTVRAALSIWSRGPSSTHVHHLGHGW